MLRDCQSAARHSTQSKRRYFIPPRNLNALVLSTAWKFSPCRTHKSTRKGTPVSARPRESCQTTETKKPLSKSPPSPQGWARAGRGRERQAFEYKGEIER